MKKILIFAFMLLVGVANAQNYLSMNITEIQEGQLFEFCVSDYDSIIFTKDSSCNNQVVWSVLDFGTQQIIQQTYDELVIIPNSEIQLEIAYLAEGCNIYYRFFYIFFHDFSVNEPWTQDYTWKRYGTSTTLQAPYGEVHYQWSTGSHQRSINVTESGTYWVRIYNDCGELYDTIEVRDNVELYRATVDLGTKLNKATWRVTAEQAEYISEVKVYRDGLLVGTAPYEDGFFLDNIGSDNNARNYKIVGVSIECPDCSIASYEKGTIHTTYYEDVNSNLNMTWNIPYMQQGAQDTLTYFQICKYDPNTSEITVVDQVNSSITDYICGVNQFYGGYAVIAAVFSNGKGQEELSFSNLTPDILGLGENDGPSTGSWTLIVYPNPAKGRVTVEGTGTITVTNALGQTVMTKGIDGKESIELPKGLYFVKMNETTRKVVVE